MPGSRPTSRCRTWRSTACSAAGVDGARRSTWPTRASCAACWPACRSTRRGSQDVRGGARRQGRGGAARRWRRASRPRRGEALRALLRAVRWRRGARRGARACCRSAPLIARGAGRPARGWRAPARERIRRCAGRLRPGRHERLCLLQRRALRGLRARRPAMRWRAAAATTRSARCSAATGRRSASAST